MRSGKWGGLVFLGLGLLTQQALRAQNVSSNTRAQKVACSVNREPASEAQKALDREEYQKAEGLFQQIITANPDDQHATARLIRALIEENKVDDALQHAESLLNEKPTSSVALEAMGEVQFRKGELETAYEFARKAVGADPCNARAYLLQSWFEGMVAMHALRKTHLITAHKLDPDDREILWPWILTLPHDDEIAAMTEYLSHRDRISESRAAAVSEYLVHAQDYKKDDCKRVPTSATTQSIPLLPAPNSRLARVIDVKFNGKTRQLNVDTSARGLVLSKRAVAALGLTPGQKIAKVGYDSKGPVDGSVARVDSLRIGQWEYRNCNVLVLQKDTPGDEEGRIGADFFGANLVTLNFSANQMQITPLPKRPTAEKTEAISSPSEDNGPHDRYIAPEMMSWSNFYRDGQTLLVPTNIGTKREKLFALRSGFTENMISIPAAQDATRVRTVFTTKLYGKSGPVTPVMDTGLMTWIFAGVGQKVEHVTAVDLTAWSHGLRTEVSGIMGAPILTQLIVYIDYRDNLIRFEPGH